MGVRLRVVRSLASYQKGEGQRSKRRKGGRKGLTFPYFSDRVCKLIAPSAKNACTSATRRSPSWKNVLICSSSDSSFRR